MTNIFVTSDTHFGHTKIIKFCKEPFTSIEQRDQVLIQNWNKKVSPKDYVYHLGDVTWYHQRKFTQIYKRLNGIIHLIAGNHDGQDIKTVFGIHVYNYFEFTALNKNFCLFHYPIREWNGMFRGSYMLHGHCHGGLKDTTKTCDVGVNNWDFTPAQISQVLDRMKSSKIEYTREYKE